VCVNEREGGGRQASASEDQSTWATTAVFNSPVYHTTMRHGSPAARGRQVTGIREVDEKRQAAQPSASLVLPSAAGIVHLTSLTKTRSPTICRLYSHERRCATPRLPTRTRTIGRSRQSCCCTALQRPSRPRTALSSGTAACLALQAAMIFSMA
jgi:hypothetical protein